MRPSRLLLVLVLVGCPAQDPTPTDTDLPDVVDTDRDIVGHSDDSDVEDTDVVDDSDSDPTTETDDTADPPGNQPPRVEILAPAAGAVALGDAVQVVAVVHDPDGLSGVTATWSSTIATDDVTGLDTVPDAAGGLDGAITFDTRGQRRVTVTVRDPAGATDTTTVALDAQSGTAPECAWTTPTDGALLELGDAPFTLSGYADDADSGPRFLTVALSSTRSGPLGTPTLDAAGGFALDVDLDLGPQSLQLVVTDGDGLTCTALRSVRVVARPTVQVTSPGSAPAPLGASLQLSATTADADTRDLASLVASFSTTQDGVLWTGHPAADGTIVQAFPGLGAGAHAWTLTVEDADGLVGTATGTWVVDAPPTVPVLHVEPTTPFAGDALTAIVDTPSTDPDGDAVTLRWAWTRDGVAAGTAVTVPSGTVHRGETWVVTATPTDGLVDGPAGAATVVVGNRAPSLASAALTPARPNRASTLTCAPSGWSDPDGDPPGYGYAWTVDGAALPGATSATLAGASVPEGGSVTCTVTPDDGLLLGAPVTSSPVRVENAAPRVTAGTLAPTSPVRTDTVSVVGIATEDDNGDPLTTSIAWSVDGVDAGTGASLSLASFHKGQLVRAVVVASDGAASSAPYELTATIANLAPVATSVTLLPVTPVTGDTLTATALGTDGDGDPLTWTFAWTVDGVLVASGPTATRTGRRGERIAVTATPSDGAATGTPVTSATVTVANAAPTLAGASLTPASPGLADTLACAPVGAADVDGDTLSFTYAWFEAGVRRADLTTATVPARQLDRGVDVTCAITAADGVASVGPRTSSAVRVPNAAPSVDAAALSPTPARRDDVVSVTGLATSDADGDAVTVRYAWIVGGRPAGTGTTLDLAAAGAARGDVVEVTLTPDDGYDAGTPVVRALTVANAAPVLGPITLTPAAPVPFTALTASVSPTDLDGDVPSIAYAWTVDGEPAGTSATLPAAVIPARAVIDLVVTIDDGHGGTAQGALSRTIANRSPTVTGVSVSPSPIHVTDGVLTGTSTVADADLDTLVVTRIWKVDGVEAFRSASSDTWTTTPDRGTSVTLTVVADDGWGGVTTVTSAPVAVVDRPPTVGTPTLPASVFPGDEVTCAHAAAADGDGDVLATTYTWYVGAVQVAGPSASPDHVVGLQRGALTCRVSVSDGYTTTTATSNGATVGNHAPQVGTLSVTPATVYRNSDVTADVSATDVDGDVLVVTYVWTRNGAPLLRTTNPVLTGVTFLAGDQLAVTAEVSDGVTTVTSNAVSRTVQNRAPSAPSLAVTPDDVYRNSVVEASTTSVDPDGDTLTFTYTWKKNGLQVQKGTSPRLTSVTWAKGDTLSVTVDVADGYGGTGSAGPVSRTVGNRPVPTVTVSIPDPLFPGQQVTAALTPPPVDPDGDPVVVRYSWYVDAQLASGPNTFATYTPIRNHGASVQAQVSVSDGYETQTATSNTAVIGNRAPTITAVDFTPTPLYRNSTIAGTRSASDVDGDPTTTTWIWTVNGTEVARSSATAALSYGGLLAGDVLGLRVEVTDGLETTSSAVVTRTVENRPPAGGTATIAPSPVYRNSTVTASAASVDADGDALTTTWVWTKNGVEVQRSTSATLTATTWVKGDVLSVQGLVSDGFGGTATTSTASTTVSNRNPTVADLAIAPSPVYRDSHPTGTATITDPDGDDVEATWRWTRNGTSAQVGPDPALGVTLAPGDTLALRVDLSDGYGGAATANASATTVANRVPEIAGFSVSPRWAHDADDLVCRGTVTDGDDPNVTVVVAWTRNGVAWTGTTLDTVLPGDTIRGLDTSRGDTWTCTISATDPYGGSTVVSGTSLVLTDLVVASGGSLTLGTAGTTTDLYYETVTIAGTLTVRGHLRLHADRITITGVVDGDGRGWPGSGGPSTSSPCNPTISSAFVAAGGTGGGSGGVGAKGADAPFACVVQAVPTAPAFDGAGSGGSKAKYWTSASGMRETGTGGAGGAGLSVIADEVVLTGTLQLSGATSGCSNVGGSNSVCGGGGGGGTLFVQACSSFTGGGSVTARGGTSGSQIGGTTNSYRGGGGGGGVVYLQLPSVPGTFPLTTDVSGREGNQGGTPPYNYRGADGWRRVDAVAAGCTPY